MHLLLLGTAGCHLCEEAAAIVHDCLPNAQIERVDIAEQEHWQARYAVRIPVLFDPKSEKELAWKFDASDVKDFINSI